MPDDSPAVILTLVFHNATEIERAECSRIFARETGRFIAIDPQTAEEFRATRPDGDTVKISYRDTSAGRFRLIDGSPDTDFRFAVAVAPGRKPA